MGRVDIKSMPFDRLTAYVTELGLPRFRAGQIYGWLHRYGVCSFDEMTNLSLELRTKLSENCKINCLNLRKRLESALDGTVKYLYGLSDGNCVETVLMKHHHGNSLCISTQAGCRMGCRFCASTIGGLSRNLTPSEMLDQIYRSGKDSGEKIHSIVLMGIGEPLDNYDNVLDFLKILSSPEGMHMSLRHVSLSTCGLVDQMDRLAREKLPLTLSVSLHATDNETRSTIMPVNKKWPIEALLQSCRRYFERTGRRVSFEYALISGQNDSARHAKALGFLLRGMNCHVNLIPVNPVAERDYRKSSDTAVREFLKILEKCGVNATVRRKLGSDIEAACGQLRHEFLEQ